MHKIQLNKTAKQSSEKKTVLNTIATNSKIIGMQCMQELFFWAGRVEVGHCVNDVFIFVKEKEP